MLRAFEIQTYRDGDWKIDSVFDDQELATYEARRIHDSGRYVGVRVVEETYDPEEDRAMTKVVLQVSKADKENNAATARQRRISKDLSVERKKTAKEHAVKKAHIVARNREAEFRRWWGGMFVKSSLIVILGIALMFGLRVLYKVI